MVHIHDKIDFTAEVFVVYRNKVLLRLHDKYGLWLAPGGHIELDEDPNEAAIREVKEEVGLDIKLWDGNRPVRGVIQGNRQLIPPVAMNRHHIRDGHEHVSLLYFGRAKTNKLITDRAQDRSDDCRWLSRAEIDSVPMRADVRALALLALDTLSSKK